MGNFQMKTWLLLSLLTIGTSLRGQSVPDKYDYEKIRSVRLRPTPFDTNATPTLIYVKRYAEVYFKQSDIKDYINQEIKRDTTTKKMYDSLLNLLNQKKSKIEIVDLLFEYYWTEKQVDSLKTKRLTTDYTRLTNHLIEFIGMDLIYEGKFMLFDPRQHSFIGKGLIGKRHLGKIGSNTFDYYLPDKRKCYSMLTALVD